MKGDEFVWNYRILKRLNKRDKKPYYAMHEVYYTKDVKTGKVIANGWTQDPVSAYGDTPKEVVEALTMMLKDAVKAPVFDEAKQEAENKRRKKLGLKTEWDISEEEAKKEMREGKCLPMDTLWDDIKKDKRKKKT
jgi:hypothetical protein